VTGSSATDIIEVDELWRAAERASAYRSEPATVVAVRPDGAKSNTTPTVGSRD
jgi:hypothetical protein